MKKTHTLLIGIIFLCTIVYGIFYYISHKNALQSSVPAQLSSYTLGEYGLEFSFPEKYFLANEVEGVHGEYVIVLAEDTQDIREVFSNQEISTDGPVSITITIFDTHEKKYSAQSFFDENSLSNISSVDKDTKEVRVGDETAIRYHATGLYENDIVVVARPDFVYIFTAYYTDPSDDVLFDFETLLSSVTFLPPEMTFDLPPNPNEILPFEYGITGKVTLEPTCPVEREGDSSCLNKPYQTTVQIIEIGSPKSMPFATTKTDSNGFFSVELPPGKYGVQAVGTTPFPRCDTVEVTVEQNKLTEVSLTCDTGIR